MPQLAVYRMVRKQMSPMLESSTAGVRNLRDLMPDDLGWSACNNNRNKVHNKCSELESSWNHPFPSVEKLSSTKQVPAARKIGDRCSIIAMKFLWRVFSFPTVVLRSSQLRYLNSVLSAALILQEVYWPSPTTACDDWPHRAVLLCYREEALNECFIW